MFVAGSVLGDITRVGETKAKPSTLGLAEQVVGWGKAHPGRAGLAVGLGLAGANAYRHRSRSGLSAPNTQGIYGF